MESYSICRRTFVKGVGIIAFSLMIPTLNGCAQGGKGRIIYDKSFDNPDSPHSWEITQFGDIEIIDGKQLRLYTGYMPIDFNPCFAIVVHDEEELHQLIEIATKHNNGELKSENVPYAAIYRNDENQIGVTYCSEFATKIYNECDTTVQFRKDGEILQEVAATDYIVIESGRSIELSKDIKELHGCYEKGTAKLLKRTASNFPKSHN